MPLPLDPHQVLPLLQCLSGAALLLWLARAWSWWPRWPPTTRGAWGKALSIAVGVLLLLPVLAFGRGYHLAQVQGLSMLPTLHPGQTILCDAHAYTWRWPFVGLRSGAVRSPRRGDVVTLYRLSRTTGLPTLLVKRVLGVGGDEVRVSQGAVWINGEPMPGFLPSRAPSTEAPIHWRVGVNEVFVVGDNRPRSNDSRRWGPVPLSQIATQVVAVHTEEGWVRHDIP